MSLCSSVFKHPFSCLHNKKDGSKQVLPIPNRLSTNVYYIHERSELSSDNIR